MCVTYDESRMRALGFMGQLDALPAAVQLAGDDLVDDPALFFSIYLFIPRYQRETDLISARGRIKTDNPGGRMK
jgi:hypothetical protein